MNFRDVMLLYISWDESELPTFQIFDVNNVKTKHNFQENRINNNYLTHKCLICHTKFDLFLHFMQNTFCFGTRAKPKNLNMEAGNTQHSNCQCIGLSLTWLELI